MNNNELERKKFARLIIELKMINYCKNTIRIKDMINIEIISLWSLNS
jgi:hypothetical protein